jgi:GNAT superfamily N-acetyltransferase
MHTRPSSFTAWVKAADMNDIPELQYGASSCVPRETIPVRIREAVPEDAPELHKVVSEAMELYRIASAIPCGQLDAGSESAGDVRDAISSVPVFVAVLPDGSIAGSVRLVEKIIPVLSDSALYGKLSLEPDSHIGYFSRFAVHEDLQGLGIGSLLYRAAERKARELHYSHLFLNTSLVNLTMVSFYERRGFVLLETDPSRGYPRGLFCKQLS